MVIASLREYLDSNGVKYVVQSHSPAYSAQEVAHLVHVPGREVAKTVIIKIHDDFAMAVLPASYHIDFHRLMDAVNTSDMYLASEDEFAKLFPDCELGAMPPFGNLYNMPVFVAQSLAEDVHITFNAGTHTDVVTMRYEDYARLVGPKVLSFTDRKRHPEDSPAHGQAPAPAEEPS